MSLRCLLVDDEPNAVSLLDMFIRESTDWQIVARCFDGLEAKNVLKKVPVDLVFLDINMPKLSGTELAALLPKTTKIVFTTAHKEHALESYNFETIDYILKPVTLKRFLAVQSKVE